MSYCDTCIHHDVCGVEGVDDEAMTYCVDRIEPCDDAISRQAAIDAMYALCDTGETLKENPWRDNPHIDAITDALDNLPPVTPTRKKGHWIDDKCFVCGKGIEDLIDSREWYRNEETKFCPFCGIKLVEPQKSEVRDADSN